jgi:hypothetical protein
MVDDDHGEVMSALKLSKEGKQGSDLAGCVFIDAVQSHEGIEYEQTRMELGDGGFETGAIGLQIEAQAGRGDHLHIEAIKRGAGDAGDTFECCRPPRSVDFWTDRRGG